MTNTTTKKIFVVLLMPLMLLSLVACGVKPVQEDVEINPPSVEDNVEDQRDEITGDNMTGVTEPVENTDLGVVPPVTPDDTTTPQQPDANTDNEQAVEPDDNTETTPAPEPEDETPPQYEEEDAPASTPDSSGSGNSSGGSSGSSGSSGTTEYNGGTIRAFPAGTDVNSLSPQEPFETISVGGVIYAWSGSVWGVLDTSTPPNQSSEIVGGGLSGEIVFS